MQLTSDSENDQMPLFSRWVYAIKIKSWPKILVPFFLGNALGIVEVGSVKWAVLIFGFFAVALGVSFIVLMNDWGDQKVDKIKREMFPKGSSPKTIPDGILPPQSLLRGGVVTGVLSFLLIVTTGYFSRGGSEILIYAILSCFMFVAYTLPPFKLNYRGGGEFLEMLGVGLVLPLFMFFLQSGQLIPSALMPVLIPYTHFSLASAVASGLSDEESDHKGGKTTFVTVAGNPLARFLIFILMASGAALSLMFALTRDTALNGWIVILANVPLIFYLWKMQQQSPKAVTNAFKEQGLYKKYLHNAIWIFGMVVAIGAGVQTLFGL